MLVSPGAERCSLRRNDTTKRESKRERERKRELPRFVVFLARKMDTANFAGVGRKMDTANFAGGVKVFVLGREVKNSITTRKSQSFQLTAEAIHAYPMMQLFKLY